MARDPKYDVLFEPIWVGPKTLRNRFYQVPHCTGFGSIKPGSQARHRAMKAAGGWAAVCTEFCAISPESDHSPTVSARLWDEDDVHALSVMCDEVHSHGALAGVELHHGGLHATVNESRWPAVAPSQVASEVSRYSFTVPKAMERMDIRRVQREWAEAAMRARSAGFDIVYVYGAHSMLPMQFLSPYYNKRTDEYGGSFENRARFWLETIELVKEAVGDDCAIAVRHSVDALGPYGVEIEEGLAFIRLADHLVDLWDVNVSGLLNATIDVGPSPFFEEGHQLEWTGRVRESTTKPVVGVSRLTSPDRMAEIVRSGLWNIIGAARPSIADPFLPKKIEEGRLDDIRECIGNNQCLVRVSNGHLGCSQNATAGEEYRRGWHPERFEPAKNADNDVLVVGAGPAGMECAIVLGKRGMRRIHLVEAESEMGGTMRWIPRLPGFGEWARIVNYRKIQIDKLANIEFIANTKLDVKGVEEYGAEIVVIATGSHWARDGLNGFTHEPIPGADVSLPHVLTPEQMMVEGKTPPGKRVVVFDCESYITGPGLAEKLARDGYSVLLVTPFTDFGLHAERTGEASPLRKQLHDLGVSFVRMTMLMRIEPGHLEALDEFQEPVKLEADAVVLVTQRVSNEGPYLELASDEQALAGEGLKALYRVGDCVAPRFLPDVIFDAHRLAREIDSPNPEIPRPYLREGLFMKIPRARMSRSPWKLDGGPLRIKRLRR